MRYGLAIVTFGNFADPRNVVRMAQAAEKSGWEGLFVWDHLAFSYGIPSGDPWVILSAVAQATRKIKIGTTVTPLPRHRPHVLANILATLDLLSGGRLICGAGLGGVPEEFGSFGEERGTKPRAEMLDEGLEVIDRLMSGQVVDHHGIYYTVEGVKLAPLPLQRPRVPIWIGGESAPALKRAARWDGWVIAGDNMEGEMVKTPEELARQIVVIKAQRRDSEAPFEFAISGCAGVLGSALTNRYHSAGATWWLETIAPVRGSLEEEVNRITAGPPR